MRTLFLAALSLLAGAHTAQAQDAPAPPTSTASVPAVDLEAAQAPSQTATFALG
jgi:hypothetical protein